MSGSIGGGKFYPGQDLSVSQLIHAARRKLQDTIFSGRYVWTITFDARIIQTQVLQDGDDLEPERGKGKPRKAVLCLRVEWPTFAFILGRYIGEGRIGGTPYGPVHQK